MDNSAQRSTDRPSAGRTWEGVGIFLILAFGLAWLPFLPVLVGGPALPILMPAAPAIAAFVVRRWVTREGFGDAGLRPGWRYWPLYLVAVLWPLAVIPVRALAALALDAAPAGFSFPWGVASPSPLQLLGWLLVSVALMPIFFGEEFGWRGYLQVRLFASRPLCAAVATGLIWGVWHYPLILAGGEPTADRLQTLLVFPPVGIVMAIFLGWLRLRTGSVWAASAGHAANNITALSLTALAFTGRPDGILDASWTLPTVLAEASILLSVVAVDWLLHRRQSGHVGDSAPHHARAAVA
jgi:membrane protease YdiL (CAAX protease family)